MDVHESIELSRRLLKPYKIPDDCPYLSEDEKELSLLSLEERIEWMAEWLFLAASWDEYLAKDNQGEEVQY
jgi:hypothetical protein